MTQIRAVHGVSSQIECTRIQLVKGTIQDETDKVDEQHSL